MRKNEDEDNDIKAILIGNAGVGKTNLINVTLGKEFNPSECTTAACSYSKKEFKINYKNYEIDLWDTAGQESYKGITKMFIKDSGIVIFVYDITNKKSFEELNYWIGLTKDALGDNFVGGIVGNKNDLYEKQEVEEKEAKQFANSNRFLFRQVSAKDNPSLFVDFLEELVKKCAGIIEVKPKPRRNSVKLNSNMMKDINKEKNKKCC